MNLPRLAPRSGQRGDEMLPLINIVFLLMIFFMLLGAISVPDPFEVEPPTSDRPLSVDAAAQVLLIAADGRLGLGGATFGLETLDSQLRRWQAAPHSKRVLMVKADAAADAAEVLEVITVVQARGIERIELLVAEKRAERR